MYKFIYIITLITFSCCCMSCNKKPAKDSTILTESTSNPAATDSTSSLTAETNGKPVIIDFYATWCGPCKRLEPILEKVQAKYHDKIEFKRVDVDNEPEMAEQYGIEAMPTLVYISADGTQSSRTVGLINENEIEERIATLLQ